MMKLKKGLLFIVATCAAFVAFTAITLLLEATGLFDSPSRIIIDTEPAAPVDREFTAWLNLAMTDYRIEVRQVDSIWHAQTQIITVVEGQVTGHTATCVPAPIEYNGCEVRAYNTADYTVEGLFTTARNMLAQRGEHVTITFDETYHFPLTIRYNDPQILDEDTSWVVVSFEPLSSANAASAVNDVQQQAWQALGITDYRLRVNIVSGGMIFGAHAYTVEVNGDVTTPLTLECFDPDGCERFQFDLTDYTVEALFETVRQLLAEEEPYRTRVTYDAVYHFPTEIVHDWEDCCGMSEDASVWSISEFEPLP